MFVLCTCVCLLPTAAYLSLPSLNLITPGSGSSPSSSNLVRPGASIAFLWLGWARAAAAADSPGDAELQHNVNGGEEEQVVGEQAVAGSGRLPEGSKNGGAVMEGATRGLGIGRQGAGIWSLTSLLLLWGEQQYEG